MKNLIAEEVAVVSGGNIIVAISAGVGICAGTARLIDNINTFNDFGRTLGEKAYTATHPNELGQMIYKEQGFHKDKNQ